MICTYQIFSGTSRKLVVAAMDTDRERVIQLYGRMYPNTTILVYNQEELNKFMETHAGENVSDTLDGFTASKSVPTFKIEKRPITWSYDVDNNPLDLSEQELNQLFICNKAMVSGETIPNLPEDKEVMVEDIGTQQSGFCKPIETINV